MYSVLSFPLRGDHEPPDPEAQLKPRAWRHPSPRRFHLGGPQGRDPRRNINQKTEAVMGGLSLAGPTPITLGEVCGSIRLPGPRAWSGVQFTCLPGIHRLYEWTRSREGLGLGSPRQRQRCHREPGEMEEIEGNRYLHRERQAYTGLRHTLASGSHQINLCTNIFDSASYRSSAHYISHFTSDPVGGEQHG